MSQFRAPKMTFKKVSNRERHRLAQDEIRRAYFAQQLLLAVLAQRGGEVTISAGTFEQIRPDMGYEVVVNPQNEKERIVRIIK